MLFYFLRTAQIKRVYYWVKIPLFYILADCSRVELHPAVQQYCGARTLVIVPLSGVHKQVTEPKHLTCVWCAVDSCVRMLGDRTKPLAVLLEVTSRLDTVQSVLSNLLAIVDARRAV